MTDREIISQFIPLVRFLGEVLGGNCEIVLHDFNDPDSSIIAISHGYLSKREIGGPMTNLLLKVLHSKENNNYLTNYKAIGPEGKEFRSSTYFIKNNKGNEIGAICINFDIEVYKSAYKALGNAFGLAEETIEPQKYEEAFYRNTDDTVKMLINETMKRSLTTFSNMSPDEKILFVKELADAGTFMYKGSVAIVAKVLKVSEPTIYRYMAKIKNDQNGCEGDVYE